MKDPKRLLDLGSGTTAAERSLLEVAVRTGGPSAAQAATLRESLAARIPGAFSTGGGAVGGAAVPSGIGEGPATAAATTPWATGALMKVGATIAVVATGALAAWHLPFGASVHSDARDSHEVAVVAASSTPAPMQQGPLVPEAPEALAGEALARAPSVNPPPLRSPEPRNVDVAGPPRSFSESSVSAGRADREPNTPLRSAATPPAEEVAEMTAPARAASLLREESRSLAAVRNAVREGVIGLARSRLAEHHARFPHGALEQERRELEIEILHRGGDAVAARAAAQAFLREYPGSPHASAVRAEVEPSTR